MVSFLDIKESVQLFYLCETDGSMQLRYAIIITNERVKVGTAIGAFVVMAMIGIAVTFGVYVFIICEDDATFCTSDDLYKVKGKSSCTANCTQAPSFVRRTYALAGIFQQD